MSCFTVGAENGAQERPKRIRLLAAAGVAAVAMSAAACSSSAGSGVALKSATINSVTVVTNAQGFTLYSFAPDTTTVSKCTGPCAQIWPPVTGPVTAGQGVTGKLGTFSSTFSRGTSTTSDDDQYSYSNRGH